MLTIKMCKIILLSILHLIAVNSSSPSDNLSATLKNNVESELSALPKQKQELVIELAIFYDSGFDQIFQNDPRKIQQYWEVVMYDLHLRFQTLPSFRISFRVTSLNVYKNAESDSLSLGMETDDQGTYYVNELLKYFQSWLYSQRENIPSFDIAFLVTSDRATLNLVTDMKMPDSICKAEDHINKKWMASAVISLLTDTSIPEILSQHIALILGAPDDDDKDFWHICHSQTSQLHSQFLCCIMAPKLRPNRVARPKFFSNCTDYHLTQKMEQINCLDREGSEEDPIIDSERLYKNPSRLYAYTGVEQCRIFLNDNITDLATEPDKWQCLVQKCVDKTTNKHLYSFTVLEGSRCGYKGRGRCFRSMCISQTVQLVNIATGKCLVSEKSQFGSNDKPVLQNCSKITTQELLGKPEVRWLGRETYIIQMSYSSRNGPSNKNLILDKSMNLRFIHKPGSTGTKWVVDIREVKPTWKEFVMQSPNLGPCLKAAQNGVNIEVTNDCSGEDRNTRWKFDFPVKLDEFRKNVETFYEIEEPDKTDFMSTILFHYQKSVWVPILTTCILMGIGWFIFSKLP